MKKFFVAAASAALLLIPSLCWAQVDEPFETDFRGRIAAGADFKLCKGLTLGLEEEFRVKDNFSSVDRFHTTLSLDYKVCPYFKIGAGYTLMNLHDYDEASSSYEWTMRHRAFFDLTGMYKTVGGWKFSLRERFQYTYRAGDMNVYQNPRNAMVLRTRAKVSYALHTKPIEPYLSVEIRNTLNGVHYSSQNYVNTIGDNVSYSDIYLNRVRIQPGLEWRLAKHHSLDFYLLGDYCYDKKHDATSKGKLKEYKIDGVQQYDSNGKMLYCLYYRRTFNTSIGISYKFSF